MILIAYPKWISNNFAAQKTTVSRSKTSSLSIQFNTIKPSLPSSIDSCSSLKFNSSEIEISTKILVKILNFQKIKKLQTTNFLIAKTKISTIKATSLLCHRKKNTRSHMRSEAISAGRLLPYLEWWPVSTQHHPKSPITKSSENKNHY